MISQQTLQTDTRAKQAVKGSENGSKIRQKYESAVYGQVTARVETGLTVKQRVKKKR